MSIFFKCPVCGYKNKEKILEEEFSVGDVIECPDCLNLILVQDRYKLEDFKDILADQVNSKKRKAESKLNEPDRICIRFL